MEKQFLEPIDLLSIASQHAHCAEYLLRQNAEIQAADERSVDTLLPVISLIHVAFELTFKAYLLHEGHVFKQYKSLLELIEMNSKLGLSKQELNLLRTLSRQLAFHKAVDYVTWESRQQLQVFCENIISLYARLQDMMPLELQSDYIQV
jgi:hypothetical protein